MLTIEQHNLVCLAEELTEVGHRILKAVRFGLDEVQPEQPFTNRERINAEIADLNGVIEFCTSYEEDMFRNDKAGEMINAKVEKLKKFLAYSQERGITQK